MFFPPAMDRDDRLSCFTHSIGLISSLIGGVWLFSRCADLQKSLGTATFGLALTAMYTTSSVYHLSNGASRQAWRVADHIAIFFLIAATHTCFMFTLPCVSCDWIILAVVWLGFIGGAVLKLRYTGRLELLSVFLYLGLGWLGLWMIGMQHIVNLSAEVCWALAGGVVYTVGVIFYVYDRRPWFHPMWHLFVLGGSACHYMAVLTAVSR